MTNVRHTATLIVEGEEITIDINPIWDEKSHSYCIINADKFKGKSYTIKSINFDVDMDSMNPCADKIRIYA